MAQALIGSPEHTVKLLGLVQEIAQAELWDEAEDGKNACGGISREFQEAREEEAQDWILRARALMNTKPKSQE